jgi:AbrB family looped-hinge helix DNA binding protein
MLLAGVGKSDFPPLIFLYMTTLVKIHRKGQMTLPSSFRAAMGVVEGSLVELSLRNGKTVITPKMVVDRSKFPNADGEYSPAQRRTIDAGLAKSDADIRAGRVSKAFSNHGEFIAALHQESAKPNAKKTKRLAK